MVLMQVTLGELIDEAVQSLYEVDRFSAMEDARRLAAEALHLRAETLTREYVPSDDEVAMFKALVAQRAEGVPVGYLTGTVGFLGVEVLVGPGVFVPRSASELMLKRALAAVEDVPDPLVVDLCTGSGAIALAVAHHRPDATVHGVDCDPVALEIAERNRDRRIEAGDTPIVLHRADVTEPGLLSELDGRVDLLLTAPPFMREADDAWLPPEFGIHQPHQAIYSGPDGLYVIRHIVAAAPRLLRSGGLLVVEHGHLHGATMPDLLDGAGEFQDVDTCSIGGGWPLYTLAVRR